MDHSLRSDRELLRIFKAGDISGFNELFDRHWQALLALARRILDDEDLAKDVLQEAFVSFYEKGKEQQIDNAKAYLYQAVKYQCFMQLRNGRISQKHLDRLWMISSSNNVEEYINAKDLENHLLHNIQALPQRCREVFYLSRYELLSNKMIAEHLNISQKTVEHQLTKALKTLRVSVEKLAVIALFTDLSNIF